MRGFGKRVASAATVLVLAHASVATAGPAQTAPPAREQSLAYTGQPECQPASAERPYVCDIGEPRPLSTRSFRRLMANNEAVRSTVRRIGMPDWAEIQRVATDAPWTNYEIRVYYRDYDRVFSFGRAFILDQPVVALLRHQGPIPPGKFAASVKAAGPNGDPWADVLRAERAALDAEERAERAERDAERAEATAQTASREFKQSLLKQ